MGLSPGICHKEFKRHFSPSGKLGNKQIERSLGWKIRNKSSQLPADPFGSAGFFHAGRFFLDQFCRAGRRKHRRNKENRCWHPRPVQRSSPRNTGIPAPSGLGRWSFNPTVPQELCQVTGRGPIAEVPIVYDLRITKPGQRPRKLRTDAGTITTGMGASSGPRTGYQSSREAVNGLGSSWGVQREGLRTSKSYAVCPGVNG